MELCGYRVSCDFDYNKINLNANRNA
jgi:hypothetical protein